MKLQKTFTVLILITSFTLLQSCYVTKKTSDFFGIETSNLNTLYLIDISGSMEGIDEGSVKNQVMREAGNTAGNKVSDAIGGKIGSILGKQVTKEATKLGAVKRKLIPAIKGLTDGKKFVIYTFNDNVTKQAEEFIEANNTTRTSSNIFVQNLKATGGTNTLEGLLEALSSIKEIQEIVLMSDGLPNSDPQAILDEIREVNTNDVIIHTIAFGEDADLDFMKKLAEENNGKFITSKM